MNRFPARQLTSDIEAAVERMASIRLAKPAEILFGPDALHFCRPGGEGLEPGWNETQKSLHVVERSGRAVRQEKPARHSIQPFQVLQQGTHLCRILTLPVVKKHVTTKMRVPTQQLIRAFPREHDFEAGIADRTAQKVLRYTMGVVTEGL